MLAAATCSPSGGGGSGGASYTRHRGRYVVRAVDLDPAVVRIFRPWALFFARARATGAPGLGAQAKTTWGRASGVQWRLSNLVPISTKKIMAPSSYQTAPRAAAPWPACSFFYFFLGPARGCALPLCANARRLLDKKY